METLETTQILTQSIDTPQKIQQLWIEVTEKCNLKCSHCYTNSSAALPLNGTMKYEDWVEVLEQSSKLGCKNVTFIGGEPTLYPQLLSLLKVATNLGFQNVEVYTNGTLLSDDYLIKLKEMNVSLAMSYYSTDEKVHNTITNGKNSFQMTQKALLKALDMNINVRIGLIDYYDNAEDLANTTKYLKSIGVSNITIDKVREFGRGVKQTVENPISELCGNCHKDRLAITNNGEAYPCVFSRFVNLGNVKSQNLKNIIEGQSMESFRSELKTWVNSREYANSCNPDCTPDFSCNPPATCGPDNCGPDQTCNPSHGQ